VTFTKQLMTEIKSFLKIHKMKDSTLGREFIGDNNLVARLKDGKTMTLSKADKLRAWMEKYTAAANKAEDSRKAKEDA